MLGQGELEYIGEAVCDCASGNEIDRRNVNLGSYQVLRHQAD